MNPIQIDIVCPVFEKLDEIASLYESFALQKDVKINKVVFPVTLSDEEKTNAVIDYLKKNNITYFTVKKEDFSHSLTRQKAIEQYCESKIVVMMSQDIKLVNEHSLYNLVKTIDSGESAFNYGRQICTNHTIERYIRKKNYPTESKLVSAKDIDEMGLFAFFSSDAFSAYNRDIFLGLGGYNGFDVMMSEDMLFSYYVLTNGYSKMYVGDAEVIHSHRYKLKQLYERYYLNGIFFKKVKLFDGYGSSGEGLKLAIYTFFQALIHFNIPVLFIWLPNMAARFLGMRKGKKAKIEE